PVPRVPRSRGVREEAQAGRRTVRRPDPKSRNQSGVDGMKRFLFLVCIALANPVWGQTYPDHAIRFVIPYPPAGTSDNLARLLAEKLRAALGQPIVVENKPGGTSSLGAELVAQAKPDGYTLLLGPMTAFS